MNIFLGFPILAADIHTLNTLLLQEHPHWESHSAIRWTPEENHHLTMHFFGPIDPITLNELTAGLDKYLRNSNEFKIKINKLYNFPKVNSDLVAAYVELTNPLARLYSEVQLAVKNFGFTPEERPYFPHITLCRSRRRHVLKMNPILLADYPINLSTLTLYQTQSTPSGNHYLPLHQWRLSNAHGNNRAEP